MEAFRLRRGGVLALGVVAVVSACGIAYQGPAPRYADAPAEPTRATQEVRIVRATPPPDAGPAAVTDAGGPDAGAADAGVAVAEDAGAPAAEGLVLATGPLTREQWDQMLAIGRGKVNRVCSECHGGIGIAPNLIGLHRTAARVRQMVRQGAGDMRRLSQRRVSDQELEAVIVFLSTTGTVTDVAPPPQ